LFDTNPTTWATAIAIPHISHPRSHQNKLQLLGQFLNYRVALKVKDPNRVLFLAVPVKVYRNFFSGELAQLSISEYHVKVIVFDPE